MNERELFKKTFDAVPAPKYLAARAAANAHTRPRRAPRRALRTALIAALIIAALSAGVAAASTGFFSSKQDLVQVCNAELDTLREMGLFHAQFYAAEEDRARSDNDGDPGELGFSGNVGVRTDEPGHAVSYSLYMDADTGKITSLYICVAPLDGWEGTPITTAWGDIWYIYDDYEAIIDPELTIGEYCGIWAAYQGYERWELPEGVDADTRFLDADTLDAWQLDVMEGTGLRMDFYRAGQETPENVWISYSPSASGPCVCFGDYCIKG